eukprot:XP_014773348.1 PREDICTED: protein FAM200A-like [Octopus bimaculoides]
MRTVLNVAIKFINFVKGGALNSRLFKVLCKDMEPEQETLLFHMNVRWLLKRNMLGLLYELREEIAIFLDVQQKADLHNKFQSEGFQLSLAYLLDIFEALNATRENHQHSHAPRHHLNLHGQFRPLEMSNLAGKYSQF